MDEAFWDAVQHRSDHPFTPAKEAAYRAGEPLPVEPYDFIRWTVSYRVCGWVIREGAVEGRPAWLIYNPVTKDQDFIFKDEAALLGYARMGAVS